MGTIGTCIIGLAFILVGTTFVWEEKTGIYLKKILSLLRIKKNSSDPNPSESKSPNTRNDLTLDQIRKDIELKRIKDKSSNSQTIVIDDGLFNQDFYKSQTTKNKNIEIPPISPNLTQKNMIMHTSNSIVRDKQVKRPTSCGKVYKLPLLKLLDEVEESSGESREAVQKAKETLQDTLDSFGVEAKVTDAVTGPKNYKNRGSPISRSKA